jgi:hypothetical protein
MFWPHFQIVLLLSACASALLWMIRPVRPVFGFAAAAGWTVLALQARNIVVDPADTATTIGSEPMQYIYLGLALTSLATVILWHLGVYPPVEEEQQDRDGGAAIPDQRARMEDEPEL